MEIARDDSRLILERDPELSTPRGAALRTLLYLFAGGVRQPPPEGCRHCERLATWLLRCRAHRFWHDTGQPRSTSFAASSTLMSSSRTSSERHIEQETGGRVRASHGRNTATDGSSSVVWASLSADLVRFSLDEMKTIDHSPSRGYSIIADLGEHVERLFEQRGLEDLLQPTVEVAHQRASGRGACSPKLDDRAADEVRGQEADQRDQHQGDDQAEAGDRELDR
jgi:hypothetical protein